MLSAFSFPWHPTGLLRLEAFPLPSLQAIFPRAAEQTEVLEKGTAMKCLTCVKWKHVPKQEGLFSCFQPPAMWVMWLVENIRWREERNPKWGGKMCWRFKRVHVNMPYCLLKGKGGSASLTLPGWCLKVWEWTTVVTNEFSKASGGLIYIVCCCGHLLGL